MGLKLAPPLCFGDSGTQCTKVETSMIDKMVQGFLNGFPKRSGRLCMLLFHMKRKGWFYLA